MFASESAPSPDKARLMKPRAVVFDAYGTLFDVRAYALGVETLRLRPAEMLFVSSNSWDVAGASSFGYMVCGCHRSNSDTESLTEAPNLTVTRIDQIADLF